MNTNLTDQTSTYKVEKLLKPEEVANLLTISRSFAYQLMQSGQIPTVRLGKSCRVRPQDLAEYLENNLHRQANPY
jgi:excisionase family DNA binding protein